jgi:hypothetical protein
MADPHGPLGSNQCSDTETDTHSTEASFDWDKPFFLCHSLKGSPLIEGCVEATCLTNEDDCSCQMYSRWKSSKNIINYCETCEVCGPQRQIPVAGNCLNLGISPDDNAGVETSCDEYAPVNITAAESELFKKDGTV